MQESQACAYLTHLNYDSRLSRRRYCLISLSLPPLQRLAATHRPKHNKSFRPLRKASIICAAASFLTGSKCLAICQGGTRTRLGHTIIIVIIRGKHSLC
ncbi:hypothetical protein EV356DRAFT_335228 [Viridothelium virens]|uniref:Uncharacterized protein n=1 Tax=Viridothelium virens TaxID=1048519 RepID=A0A6A6HJ32_VIRVR|nr:hypothetical protein EV356DRAFT_335228 [Viridothelium virens]